MDLSEPAAVLPANEYKALESKALELQRECLQAEQESQPKNTRDTYEQCWREWRAWCAENVPKRPSIWPPVTRWTDLTLPGDLVDEPKMLLFMKYITETAPKSGKRVKQERLAQLARQLDRLESGTGTDEDLLTDSQLKLSYNSVRGYISALLKLYDNQHTMGENPASRPLQLGVKCLQRYLLRSKWARDRRERVDRVKWLSKTPIRLPRSPITPGLVGITQNSPGVDYARRSTFCSATTCL
jgi:hypothetical protein